MSSTSEKNRSNKNKKGQKETLDLDLRAAPTKSKTRAIKPSTVQTSSIHDKAKSYVEEMFGVSSKKLILPNGKLDLSQVPDNFDATTLIDEADAEFDLVKLIGKSVDPLTGIPRDIKLPEGDFKEASNFFDFCVNFRGPESKFPFARQMWIMLMLFAEVCPVCTPKKMFDIFKLPVDDNPRNIDHRMQLLHYGVCPKCQGTKAQFFANNQLRQYMEMSLCIGQRAGKSTTVAAGTEYITHKYLMYPKMSSVCRGISASTPLTATFVGFRFADAYNLLWTPVLNGIRDSAWFVGFHAMLEDYGNRLGIEFLALKDSFLKYRHKNLELAPSGPTKRGLRGRTRWLSAIDELGWFPVSDDENDERENADANGTYDALDRSLLTLRTEVSGLYDQGHNRFLQAYAFNISSPSTKGDKINRLVEENKNSDTSLALRLATWEVSPFYARDNKIIADAYRKDPVAAERDFGANPPENTSIFIQLEEAVPAFSGQNRCTIREGTANINDKWRQAAKIEVSAPPSACPATLMSLDAGLTNNSFAITILSLQETRVGDISSYTIGVPVCIEIQPRKGHMLHYPMIYKGVVKPLIKDFNTRFLFADRWNSITTLDTAAEDFADQGLVAKQYSVKYNDFVTTRSYVEEGKIILPKLEMEPAMVRRVDTYPDYFLGKPASHLLFQMITVRDRGKTVVKGDGYTDDLFRALVLGVSRILDDKIRPEILRINALNTRSRVTGAVAAGRSSMPRQGQQALQSYVAATSRFMGHGAANVPGSQRPAIHRGNVHVVRIGRS